MGLSRESDNGKSNKVTQCPKLKVFKLMEQKDLDPEKIRLLKQKQKEKKKKYSESRSKIAQDLYESSSTERFQQPKRKSSTAVQDKERFDYGRQDVFETYEGETKNGWYRDRQDKLKESPSRISCALKKLLGSEYACAGCFALIFLVTIVAGLLLVFKVMSSTSDMTVDDSMKVHRAKGKRQSDDYDIFGGRRYREKILDDGYQFPIYTTAPDKNEFGYTDLPEQSSNGDITNIMNGAEIMDSDNEKLRDFYKKLIETDAEIKRVKQNLQTNIRKYDKSELERIKRSLKKTQSNAVKQRLHKGNRRLNIISNRQSNGTDDVYGIVIQEQEVIVYEPIKSENNNDRKFYKKHYKHSFCKHKQKIEKQNNMLKNNFKNILKEEKNHINYTDANIAKYYRDNIVNAVPKDNNTNVPFKSNNNVDMIYLPSFENLNILSNTTMNKGENISQNSKNVNHLRRNIYAGNEKYQDKLPKELSRKGRSLMSFQEEHYYTDTESAGVDKSHYIHTNETDYGNNKYRITRLFKTSGSNSVTTSNLNALMNLTHFDKTSAAQGISTVGNFKENTKNAIVRKVNKISRHIEGYSTNFTTESLINKAEVKREADNKLVFWDKVNDDRDSAKNYLDGKTGSGACIKKRKMQKSKDWFKAKMHNLIERRKKPNKIKNNYSNDGLSTKVIYLGETFQSIPNWRKIRTLQHAKDNDKDMDNIFKKLNAKMETVCREAAYAIQNTKNIKVRESNADIATSTLMQRLVRMMRDLVDMQVQEKTCVELPPDLRQFLEWLVPPPEVNPQADDLNPDISDYVAIKKELDGFDKSNDIADQPLSFAEDTDEAEVDKMQCMETIRAVQDLVDQYEGLSSDDKYKLSGVRDYLQRQLRYLNKLVGDVNTENTYWEADDRVKRETNKNKRKFDKRTKNSRLGNFMQRLRMKHTKATTQALDKSFSNNVTVKDKEIVRYTGHKLNKTNDIYNRALEEAKRLTIDDVYTNHTIMT